jgi:hypothetical protein
VSSYTTRPSRDPGPVVIWFDCRGGRACKRFATGGGRSARKFFAEMMKAGRNPTVKPAGEGPTLFAPPPGETGA